MAALLHLSVGNTVVNQRRSGVATFFFTHHHQVEKWLFLININSCSQFIHVIVARDYALNIEYSSFKTLMIKYFEKKNPILKPFSGEKINFFALLAIRGIQVYLHNRTFVTIKK